MKVLIAEDDENIAEFLCARLPSYGFAVDHVPDAESAIRNLRINGYDLVLLDLHLPDMSGATVIEALKRYASPPPVLMLTVVADAWSKAELINAGADDYLAKPFLLEELIARMRALLRRPRERMPDLLSACGICLNPYKRTAERDGRDLELTATEFALLEYLLRSQGRVVPKAELVEHVWDSAVDPFSAAVDTHLTNVRRKLGEPRAIETIHRRGYLIRA